MRLRDALGLEARGLLTNTQLLRCGERIARFSSPAGEAYTLTIVYTNCSITQNLFMRLD